MHLGGVSNETFARVTDVVLLLAGDGVAADFSVLNGRQVPGEHKPQLGSYVFEGWDWRSDLAAHEGNGALLAGSAAHSKCVQWKKKM